MNKFQKLSQISKDIEILENAGKIKAADVLHKKFIKEAQYAMPQMMTTMMPQMMMPQMMMPQMMPQMMPMTMARPVAPGAVARPVVAPAAVAKPVGTPAPVQQGQVNPPATGITPPTPSPAPSPAPNPAPTPKPSPGNMQIEPPNPMDDTQRGYGDQQSKNQEMQYLMNEKKRLEEMGATQPNSPYYQQYQTILEMIKRNQGGSVIKKSENMNKLQKLAQLNQDIELLETAGKFKAAEVLQKKFVKEAQSFVYPDTSGNYDTLGYSGPRQDIPNTYGNEELNSQIRQNILKNKQQNPSIQTSNPAESDTANVNAFNEGMNAQIKPLSSTPQLDYKTLINQAKNYIASGDMNTAAQIKQQAFSSNMTDQQKAAWQQQYNTLVQNYSNTANNPKAFQAQENAQNAIAKAAKLLGINTNDPKSIRENEQKLRSKLQQMDLLKDKNVQNLLRQISLSGYFIK